MRERAIPGGVDASCGMTRIKPWMETAGDPDASQGQKFSEGLIERSRFVPDPRNDGGAVVVVLRAMPARLTVRADR
jgi:hypothetical protein